MAALNAVMQDLFGYSTEDMWHTAQPFPLIDNKVTVGHKQQDNDMSAW